MHRMTLDPRPNWQKRVEEYGLHYHTLRGEKYWDESAAYQLSSYEVDTLDLKPAILTILIGVNDIWHTLGKTPAAEVVSVQCPEPSLVSCESVPREKVVPLTVIWRTTAPPEVPWSQVPVRIGVL